MLLKIRLYYIYIFSSTEDLTRSWHTPLFDRQPRRKAAVCVRRATSSTQVVLAH